ncbi:hypothetical protein M899_0782 [Bacteriovorax sp. BSW11_IV]|uniref:hypothetical protein n=1 Tax=Bacteriovorax sp. BSW11_IV TaxID=1353529 RepID=UPI000389E100|nr:hypothetical protein [Bacteriovorax sp. BSW11_IV]EQC49210.1 hypothetical protein M899_0782 [Bacteriovorax sp. BSW11_IV]
MAKAARIGKAFVAKEGYVINLPRIVRTRVTKTVAVSKVVENVEDKKEKVKEESKK